MPKRTKLIDKNSGKEKCFTVTWEARVIIGAQIWAESPEDAINKAQNCPLDDLVNPSGCFSASEADSYECVEDVDGATKEEYEPGGSRYIAIYF